MDFDDLDEVAAERAAEGDEAALAAMGAPSFDGAKIHYWPAVGRNRQIQLCLAELGATWEDVHWGVNFLDNPAMRDDFFANCSRLGGNSTTNVPMLEMNGKYYTQSSAILKMIGRKGGLYPKSIDDCYRVDNIIAAADDLRTLCYGARGGATKFLQSFKEEILPKHIKNLMRLLGDEEFFLPGEFSVADITVFDVLHTYGEGQFPGCLDVFPKAIAFRDRVASRPRIRDYLSSDQALSLKQVDKTPI